MDMFEALFRALWKIFIAMVIAAAITRLIMLALISATISLVAVFGLSYLSTGLHGWWFFGAWLLSTIVLFVGYLTWDDWQATRRRQHS